MNRGEGVPMYVFSHFTGHFTDDTRNAIIAV